MGLKVRMTSTVRPVPCWKETSGKPTHRELTRDESADQELSEEASYRETIRGMRSFMGWHKVNEFESVSSSDDNPFCRFTCSASR